MQAHPFKEQLTFISKDYSDGGLKYETNIKISKINTA